jgi:hypothetical protein
MGALIHTKGTGFLMYFYNTEFEGNWAFHQANAAQYQAAAAACTAGTSNAWLFMSSFYDATRQIYPLMPTPPAGYPNLVPRWAYFFNHSVFTPPHQADLLNAIYYALTTAPISGILFGVRHGAMQQVDSVTLNGGVVEIQLINIVVAAAMPAGRDHTGKLLAGGPPPLDH